MELILMKTTLVIFFLNVQSSYTNNTETRATDEAFDTVQSYASSRGAWRIKTFATDQDIHVWELGGRPTDLVAMARANTEKHYGDVLAEGYVIETDDGIRGVRRELKARGLPAQLEKSKSGLVFWAPNNTNYRTKSTPRQLAANAEGN